MLHNIGNHINPFSSGQVIARKHFLKLENIWLQTGIVLATVAAAAITFPFLGIGGMIIFKKLSDYSWCKIKAPSENKNPLNSVHIGLKKTLNPMQKNMKCGWRIVKPTAWLSGSFFAETLYFSTKEFPFLCPTCGNFWEAYSIDSAITLLSRLILAYNDEASAQQFKIFAIPIVIAESHWTLLLVDVEKRTVEYYDSLVNYGNYQEIELSLKNFSALLSEKIYKDKPFKFIQKVTKKIQNDSYQCGAWICYFLETRLKNPENDFNSTKINIQEFRVELADRYCLVDGSTIEGVVSSIFSPYSWNTPITQSGALNLLKKLDDSIKTMEDAKKKWPIIRLCEFQNEELDEEESDEDDYVEY